jgi:hypothetical protein
VPAFETLQQLQNDAIRKFRNGSVFLSFDLTKPLPARLTSASDNAPAALTGFTDLGLLSEDGASFSSDVSTSDTTVWQRVEPARSDVVSKTNTLAVSCAETKRATIELYTGKDLSALVPATGGAVVFDDDATPNYRYARVLSIGVDDTNDGPIYYGRALHYARVTGLDDQGINKSDDGLRWGVTLTGFVDPTAKSAQRWYFEGAGWNAQLARYGFAAPATP